MLVRAPHGILVPKPPFRLQRGVVPEGVETIATPGDRGSAAGGTRLDGTWRIDLGSYSFEWPEGFELTEDPDEISPFLLQGVRDSLLWIAGPLPREKVLPVEKLVEDEQRIRAIADSGDDVRVDIDYVVDAEPWWQRRYVRLIPGGGGALVLSAQARAGDEDAVRAAIELVDRSLRMTTSATA